MKVIHSDKTMSYKLVVWVFDRGTDQNYNFVFTLLISAISLRMNNYTINSIFFSAKC